LATLLAACSLLDVRGEHYREQFAGEVGQLIGREGSHRITGEDVETNSIALEADQNQKVDVAGHDEDDAGEGDRRDCHGQHLLIRLQFIELGLELWNEFKKK